MAQKPKMPDHHAAFTLKLYKGYMLQAFLILSVTSLSACAMSPHDEAAVKNLLEGPHRPVFHEYQAGGRSIHYVAVGEPGKRLVVFLHGTPGSWKAFAEYLADDELVKNAYLISVDRPGFGKSDYKKVVASLQHQAALLQPILQREGAGRKVILVGHSLGAPIVARLAMDYPKLVDGMIFVAPSLDPALETPRWYNRLAASHFLSWAVPTELALANKEVMPLEQELLEMLPLWRKIQVPVIVIQGGQDSLVSPGNADFAERELGDCSQVIRLPDAGHFILWKNPEIIRDAILSMLYPDDTLQKQIALCRLRPPATSQ